jgi:ribosomal protein S18 acetylase RimI-like enzyme
LKKLSNEEFDAYESKIDTQFFGVTSAKVVLKNPCSSEQKQDKLIHFMHEFEFIMIVNKNNNSINNQWIGRKTRSVLVDINTQLQKQVKDVHQEKNQTITITDSYPKNEQIIQIAKTAFLASRFLKDPFLSAEKAPHIYADIVNNAFEKKGRFFAIQSTNEKILGFILFSINHPASSLTIELFAVDEQFVGQGLGKQLLDAVESYAFHQGIETIIVGTQLENFDAIKSYIKKGFKIFECNSVYHYWPLK